MAKKSSTIRPRAAPFVPAQVTTTRELAELQRAMWTLISRPLTAGNRMPRRWLDGRPTREIAAQIAKPNDRLTSVDRLEIYSRVYWFRVLDSLYEDCPGLRAILGGHRFMKLAEAYLVRYPSRSFTLRNLPDRLARFIREQPALTRPYTALCHDMARFEWARVEVFDTAAFPLFTAADLRAANPARLKLNLQPYLQLLKLDYPVDDFILAVKQREELSRGEASNTSLTAPGAPARARKLPRPRPARTYVAVHRVEGTTYFKRLEPAGFKILTALRAGRTLQQALAAGIPAARHPRGDWAGTIQGWFQNWMELGWFCRRE
jgi:hypothetical protein